MEFIRDDGRIYNISHKDTQRRLTKSPRFSKLDNTTVKELKQYASDRGITGYSNMTRDKLIEVLGGDN